MDRPTCSPATRSSTSPRSASPLPGLNLCGAGRVVCLIDPVGDVYACPFVIHDEFLAGTVRDAGGFTSVWRRVGPVHLAARARQPGGVRVSCGSYDACQGGCMAAKFFVGLELDDPDPECVLGNAEPLLAAVAAGGGASALPRPGADHSRPGVPVPSPVTLRPTRRARS